MTPSDFVLAVRNELAGFAFAAHRVVHEAGAGDRAEALDALALIEQHLAAARAAIVGLPEPNTRLLCSGCWERPATWLLGKGGGARACDGCVALPKFRRFQGRTPIETKET